MALLIRSLARKNIFCASRLRGGLKYSTSMKDSLPDAEGRIDQSVQYPILKKNIIPEADKKKIQEEVAEETKDWISYGFSYTNRIEDETKYHTSMFFCITLVITTMTILWNYAPDPKRIGWVTREAFLELERREENGLPLIDPNYIPLEKLWLPTEEELIATNTELIV